MEDFFVEEFAIIGKVRLPIIRFLTNIYQSIIRSHLTDDFLDQYGLS